MTTKEEPTIKTAAEFCERLERKETVDRFNVSLGFEWNSETSATLRATLANLTWTNLTWANLTGADLTGAKGAFTFNFGVKMQVVEEK